MLPSDRIPFSRRRSPTLLRLLFAVGITAGIGLDLGTGLLEGSAHAQVLNAQIQGQVVAAEDGKPLVGATVTVSGPALPELQAELTDSQGRYVITQLPPGDDYTVSVYYGAGDKPLLERPGVRLSAAKTVNVDAKIRTRAVKQEVTVIRESAPVVDVANANTGIEINQENLRQMPIRGRSFQGALFLAPGASDIAPRNFNGANGPVNIPGSDVGVSISGSTGAENSYLIDGVNATDPALGVIAADIMQYFVKELNVLTGGYQAEYGRATGGLVSLVTKSGSNELHGGVYGSWVPYQPFGTGVARLGEAILTRTRPDMNTWDLGVDLGGAIIKDRIWFYAAFGTTSVSQQIQRQVRTLVFNGTGPRPLSNYNCPSYLADSSFCEGAAPLALETQETDHLATFAQKRQLYNAIAKLQFHLSEDHDLFLNFIASPSTLDTVSDVAADPDTKRLTETFQVYDLSLRYQGKVAKKRLQLDAMYAFHYQQQLQRPLNPNQIQYNYNGDPANPYSLADFEALPECQRFDIGRTGTQFNPCPITTYGVGLGFSRDQTLQRHQALLGVTAFVHALGVHAIKAGLDFEYIRNNSISLFSGPPGTRAHFDTFGGDDFGLALGFGAGSNDTPMLADQSAAVTQARNFAVYLRDSWSIASTGIVLNAGVRWEGMQLVDQDGNTRIDLLTNFAPRVGAVWDFTRLTKRPGRGKLFVNYARFYQSIPLDLGERAFSGQSLFVAFPDANPPGCPRMPYQPGGRTFPIYGPSCNFDVSLLSGTAYDVRPTIKPATVDEITAGISMDVGWDFVLGASYIYRDLTNVMEDFSLDDGSTFQLGTPGAPDPELRQKVESEAAAAAAKAALPGATDADREAATAAQAKVDALNEFEAKGKPSRTYHALVLTASKRLSHRFSMLASYAFSQTTGDYSFSINSSTGQFNPHTTSQYDVPGFTTNRYGRLPTDRPHNFKITGFYQQPVKDKGSFTAGLTFSAISGRPIEVLGGFPGYGVETFVLPRGSGGRTPAVTQFDLHLGYDHAITQREKLGLYVDIINLFNQRAVTNVDETYTNSSVVAITDPNQQASRPIRFIDPMTGAPRTDVILNSNYGQPTAFQAPLYIRVGGRLTF